MTYRKTFLTSVTLIVTLGAALLVLPTAQAAGTSPQTASPQQVTEATCYQGYPYVVQAGDDLGQIAARFGTTVANLIAFNDLSEPAQVQPDQTICIDDGTYVVQSGDTLDAIAAQFGVTLTALEDANAIVNPGLIDVGQVLVIPGSDVPVQVPLPFDRVYIVQRGDTVDEIAAQFGLQPAEIIEANQLADPNLIETGQRLVIPDQYQPDLYTVQPGDTLSGIAAQYGTTVGVLAQANQIINVNLIYPNQVIIVPEPIG